MRVNQLSWSEPAVSWGTSGDFGSADLVLVFGTRDALACASRPGELRGMAVTTSAETAG